MEAPASEIGVDEAADPASETGLDETFEVVPAS